MDPLTDACFKGDLEKLKSLVECGADVNDPSTHCLVWAVCERHPKIVKYLIDCRIDVHRDNDYSLRVASFYGYLDVVKILVENGANINAYDGGALTWASKNVNFDVVKYLIECGAKIYDSALEVRAFSKEERFRIIKFLIDNGGNRDAITCEYCLSRIVLLDKIKNRKATIIQKRWKIRRASKMNF